MNGYGEWSDFALLQDVANIAIVLAVVAAVIGMILHALRKGADRLDHEGYWGHVIAKRGKRHHGPISSPDRKVRHRRVN